MEQVKVKPIRKMENEANTPGSSTTATIEDILPRNVLPMGGGEGERFLVPGKYGKGEGGYQVALSFIYTSGD
jgi:hypothetical protein